jgi:hypothetical protein
MKFSIKFFDNWQFWKMLFFWVGHFECFFLFFIFIFAFFPWKQVKGYGLVRMGQNFEQAKREGTFWPIPTLLFHCPEFIFHIMKSRNQTSVLLSACCSLDNFWGNWEIWQIKCLGVIDTACIFRVFFTFDDLLFIFTNLNCIWPDFWWANRKQIFTKRVDWSWVHLSISQQKRGPILFRNLSTYQAFF